MTTTRCKCGKRMILVGNSEYRDNVQWFPVYTWWCGCGENREFAIPATDGFGNENPDLKRLWSEANSEFTLLEKSDDGV